MVFLFVLSCLFPLNLSVYSLSLSCPGPLKQYASSVLWVRGILGLGLFSLFLVFGLFLCRGSGADFAFGKGCCGSIELQRGRICYGLLLLFFVLLFKED